MRTCGSKEEPWMEPVNRFLVGHRSELKQFVDSICEIPADQSNSIVPPSYATPLQILGRLPPTSCEGIPSLPFLIDYGLSFANLVKIWLEVAPERLADVDDLDPSVKRFHEMALHLRERTEECLSRAEQAARPSGCLEAKWEKLVNSMEHFAKLYDQSSKPTIGLEKKFKTLQKMVIDEIEHLQPKVFIHGQARKNLPRNHY